MGWCRHGGGSVEEHHASTACTMDRMKKKRSFTEMQVSTDGTDVGYYISIESVRKCSRACNAY